MDFEKFNPSLVDKKWQKYWAENKIFKCSKVEKKPKYYLHLIMAGNIHQILVH